MNLNIKFAQVGIDYQFIRSSSHWNSISIPLRVWNKTVPLVWGCDRLPEYKVRLVELRETYYLCGTVKTPQCSLCRYHLTEMEATDHHEPERNIHTYIHINIHHQKYCRPI